MTSKGSNSLPAIGFVTVREYAELGLIGGYLILNAVGRPLEFHCTAPVRPNRAQEILYGPTLDAFVYGEQIAQTLIGKGKAAPLFICTDLAPVLAAREHVSLPLVMVRAESTEQGGESEFPERPVESGRSKSRLVSFPLGSLRAAVAEHAAEDREEVVRRWEPYAGELDLLEPFSRLADALDEAQRAAPR